MRFVKLLILCVFILFISVTGHAKRFVSPYVSFELPDDWKCNLEGTEWVCISKFSRKAKEAIIILTAKEVGPSDTLKAYMAHLKTPRVLTVKGKGAVKSKVNFVRQINIAYHPWVDGFHLGSEISSYYTRYLATVKTRIAVLVTFSAHQSHYTKYSRAFQRAVESLRITAPNSIANDLKRNKRKGGKIFDHRGSGFAGPTTALPDEPEGFQGFFKKNREKVLGAFLILLALAGYFLLKKGKKKKVRRPKK